MRTNYSRFFILICIISLPVGLMAQVSPDVTRKFPANVITRIYDVTSKVNLSTEQQMRLGYHFIHQDSLAAMAINRGATAEELSKLYSNTSSLKQILTPLEMNDYLTVNDNSASKFAVAIKYRIKLRLSPIQINTLFNQLASTVVKTSVGAAVKRYEAEQLPVILDKDQYFALLLIVTQEKAMLYANDDWQQIKRYKMDTKLDSATTRKQIFAYQSNKVASEEIMSGLSDAAEVDLARKKIDDTKPLIIQKLEDFKKASKTTDTYWRQLKAYKLTANLDSAQVNNQNFKYEIIKAAYARNAIINNSLEKKDSIKRVLQINKPRILIKLDAYNNNLPKTQFAEALKYRKELLLEPDQIDSILSKVTAVELLKFKNKVAQVYEFDHVRQFEYDNLIRILSVDQYSKYLGYKVQNTAISNSKKDWRKLQELGLAKGLDSAAVQNENLTYETNWLIANENLSNDKSQKNAFAKKELESNKPDNLKKIDMLLKNMAATNNAKQSLAW